MKILHIITGLGAGGAETMLSKLLTRFHDGGPEGEVICLTPEGPMAAPIRALGVPVTAMGLTAGAGVVFGLPGLIRAVRRARPDIVQCWMYHANLLGGGVARVAGRAPVLWGLRQSNLDPARSKRGTVAVAKLGARLSRWVPRRIVCVSESARSAHMAMGYDSGRMVVIPNGFDCDLFHPDRAARAGLRAELGLAGDVLVVGIAARFDPQKDIGTFVAAAARVAAAQQGIHFVLCGEGMDGGNMALTGMVAAHGLEECMHPLGHRDDMPYVTAAFDIAVSSSAFGEGFSNALGESLACGVPVVATDVGDSRAIAGDAGRVVPPGDPGALADAICDLITLEAAGRATLGAAGRARMIRDYGIAAIAERYQRLYDTVLNENKPEGDGGVG